MIRRQYYSILFHPIPPMPAENSPTTESSSILPSEYAGLIGDTIYTNTDAIRELQEALTSSHGCFLQAGEYTVGNEILDIHTSDTDGTFEGKSKATIVGSHVFDQLLECSIDQGTIYIYLDDSGKPERYKDPIISSKGHIKYAIRKHILRMVTECLRSETV